MRNRTPNQDDVRDRALRKNMLVYAAVALAILFVALGIHQLWGNDDNRQFNEKVALLEKRALADPKLESAISQAGGKINSRYTVFFSVCDTQSRALVESAQGETLKSAWDNAAAATQRLISSQNYNPVWVKADIVKDAEITNREDLGKKTRNLNDNFFRRGIAFDYSFDTALLEAEINGNKIIDYEQDVIDPELLNKYLVSQGRQPIDALPDGILTFSCYGYFCDENNVVYDLYTEDLDYGRRQVDKVDKELVGELISRSGRFLANIVKEDGQFVYGYYPTYDKEISNYNILRHAGAIWGLVALYDVSGDETVLPKIDSTIQYLIRDYIEYPDEDTAYVIERKADEVKLGGNGITVVMLIDYMQRFGNDSYRDLVVKLGNGILAMQNPATGEYYHVLNSADYSLKEEDRTIYYDGEATFALAKLYGLTGDEKYLTGAIKAVDYFIANDYAKHRDHWIAYCMNEITKYVPEERYFEFALKNANDNLDRIYKQKTSYHTYLELLMATFETYDRIKQNSIPVGYMSQVNESYFIDTIYKRARHQLNGYLYPEYAMYLKNPARIVNTFCVRHDGYRIRIDDVQHFIGGYYSYYRNYEKLEAYRLKLAESQ